MKILSTQGALLSGGLLLSSPFTEFYVTTKIDNFFLYCTPISYISFSSHTVTLVFAFAMCVCHNHAFLQPSIFNYVTTPSHRERISSIIETSVSYSKILPVHSRPIYLLDESRTAKKVSVSLPLGNGNLKAIKLPDCERQKRGHNGW